jgi:hypothetical protein
MGTSADSIRVVGEADLLDLARVARTTWQNWVRKGVIEDSDVGVYREDDVAEVVTVTLLVDGVGLRRARAIWPASREHVIGAGLALDLEEPGDLLLVVDPYSWETELCSTANELWRMIGEPLDPPRARIVVPVAARIQAARRAFWTRAQPVPELAKDRRRRARAGKKGGAGKNASRQAD